MANIPATPDNDDERIAEAEYTEDQIIPRNTPYPDTPIIPNDADAQANAGIVGPVSPIIPNDAELQADDEDVDEVVVIEGVEVDEAEPVTAEEAEAQPYNSWPQVTPMPDLNQPGYTPETPQDTSQPVMPANTPVSDDIPASQAAPTPYENQAGYPTQRPLDTGQPVMPAHPQVPGGTAMQVGMPVVDANGVPVGQVKAVNEQSILVDRPMQRDLSVPMNAVSMMGNQIVLSIPVVQAENLGWGHPSTL